LEQEKALLAKLNKLLKTTQNVELALNRISTIQTKQGTFTEGEG